MKLKRITAFFMALILTLSVCPLITGHDHYSVSAQTVDSELTEETAKKADRYFYDQLTDAAKVFYDAMVKMLSDGTFKTGSESLELTGDYGALSQNTVASYMSGQGAILADYGAARDAFYMDHADVFYVDFSNLSVRVTGKDGVYHAYLGAGRQANYYTAGFTSANDVDKALEEYNKTVDLIVSQAKALTASANEDLTAKQVEFVHDYITKNTSYKLENACEPENVNLIRTSYGCLVRGEAVCEGYARAFKSILDRLDIPCVLVMGIYQHSSDAGELHMWANVEINGKWYGVDPTMDDPIPVNKTGDANTPAGLDGYENSEYLLVGDATMGVHHMPSDIMSAANYSFKYPGLEIENFGVESTSYDNGLVVKYNPNGELEGVKSGEYTISFRGMGYAAAAKQGYYMLARFYSVNEDTQELEFTDWYYINPQMYDNEAIKDSETELWMQLPQVEYIEFAITEVEPSTMKMHNETFFDSTYYGDPIMLTVTTGMLHNPSGTYKAPPYPMKVTPSVSGRIYRDTTYHVVVKYDDVLVPDGKSDVGYVVTCEEKLATIDPSTGLPKVEHRPNTTGPKNCKVENFKWEGDTVTFDFTPSQMWADESIAYIFSFTGLVGKTSGKAPLDISYVVSERSCACAYWRQGIDWNVFGKPSLLEDSDLSVSGWETSDGLPVDEALKHRMALVATTPSHAQTDVMNGMIDELLDEQGGGEMLKSETYNISLTVCKQQVIKTGDYVRVSLGFPEGYGPDDAGVTFKAYHFIKDSNGTVVEIEEIPCVVTPYGLLITCKSFSPFAIAAVRNTAPVALPKTLILSGSAGGSVSSVDKASMFNLAENESAIIDIIADENYLIDSLDFMGKYEIVEGQIGSEFMKIKVSASDLEQGSNIINVGFAAKTVKQAEKANGETVVLESAKPARVSIADFRRPEKGWDFVIKPSALPNGNYTYQWFKDGVALVGQTDFILRIPAAEVDESIFGSYTLEVTTIAGSTSVKVMSNVCKVTEFFSQGVDENGYPTHTNHVWGDSVIVKPAIPCANGKVGTWGDDKHTCLVCGKEEIREGFVSPHIYDVDWEGNVVHLQPTQDRSGMMYVYCQGGCGNYYRLVLPPLNYEEVHQFNSEWTVTKPATCTQEGERSNVCSLCGKTITESIPATGHKGEWTITKKPSCTEEGEQNRTCTECGTKQTQTIPANGHTPGEWKVTKEPSCAVNGGGKKTLYCSVCNEVIETEIIPRLEHTYGEWVEKYTDCTIDGIQSRTCEVCGYTQTRVIPAIGRHSWGEDVVVREGDCTTDTKGLKTRTCDVCGMTDSVECEPVHDVVWDEDNYRAPDCNSSGFKGGRCKKCGKYQVVELPKTGHRYGEEYVLTEPTCEKMGAKARKCEVCGDVIQTGLISSLGHTFVEFNTATCVSRGESYKLCTRCGNRYEVYTVLPLGHDWNDDYTVDKEPTCTADGSESIHCSRCDAVKDSRTVSALGHDFGAWTTSKNATCTEDGEEKHECSVCGEIQTRTVKATGHDQGEWKVTKEPACTEKGEKKLVCTKCQTVLQTVETDALGHDWGEWITTKEAGCIEAGEQTRTCSVCSAKETRPLNAKGHNFVDGVCTVCGVKSDSEPPKTGDGAFIGACVALIVVSVSAFAAVLVCKRRIKR